MRKALFNRLHQTAGHNRAAASFADVRRHVFDPDTGALKAHDPVSKFIWAKIPFGWMWAANRLPGKAAHVGLALWFLAGVKRSTTFKLTAEAVDLAGCGRKSLYAGLTSLQNAGLITASRRLGCRPTITLNKLPLPATPEGGNPNVFGEEP